jgi:hypothetical protein
VGVGPGAEAPGVGVESRGTTVTALQIAPILLGLLVLLPALVLSRRRPDPHRQALRSLATPLEVFALTPRGVEEAARRLRKGIGERPLPKDISVTLGRLEPRGPVLRASWEDVVVAVMAPRAGKTTSLVVPAVLDAPGPVVMTSNKSDGWAATAQLRAEVGTAWLFDPQAVATGQQSWWWDVLEQPRAHPRCLPAEPVTLRARGQLRRAVATRSHPRSVPEAGHPTSSGPACRSSLTTWCAPSGTPDWRACHGH